MLDNLALPFAVRVSRFTTILHRREEAWVLAWGLRFGMHAGASTDDQVPRRVHQVVVPLHDLPRPFAVQLSRFTTILRRCE